MTILENFSVQLAIVTLSISAIFLAIALDISTAGKLFVGAAGSVAAILGVASNK